MKTKQQATILAKAMVDIGKGAGKKICAVITNMNLPLGNSVGCTLEVIDAIEVLNGVNNNLAYLSKFFSAKLLEMATGKNYKDCINQVEKVIADKSALNKFAQLVQNQGGDKQQILNCDFALAPVNLQLTANKDGYINDIDAIKISQIVSNLGGARTQVGGSLKHNVGVKILKHYSSKVVKGEVIAEVYADNQELAQQQLILLQECFKILKKKPKQLKLIEKIIN